MFRGSVLALLILLGADAVRPAAEVHAQELQFLPAMVGGAAGLAAGGYVAIGIVTAQARRGSYLYSTEDVLGWHAVPVLVGPGVGFLIGLFDQERLRRTVIGGAAGGIVGTGIGFLAGLHFWAPPEGKWAGGVIGGAAGLLLGSLAGVVWPEPSAPVATETGAPARPAVPFGFSLRF